MNPDVKVSHKIKEWWLQGHSESQIKDKAYALNAALNGDTLSNDTVDAHIEFITSHTPIYWKQESSDAKGKRAKRIVTTDPGFMPKELMNVPGFINMVKEYSMRTSAYPNEAACFSAALSLMAVLAGRKITDDKRTTTALYTMCLASSASGKNRGREVNKDIFNAIGLSSHLGEQFASAEGIEDAMEHKKVMLYQNDEFDTFLTAAGKAAESRWSNIIGTILRMFSETNSKYNMRRLAKETEDRFIVKPSLSIYGTAIPKFFFGALTEQMLTNGFLSRFLIIQSNNKRVRNKNAIDEELPQEIIDIAQWWSEVGGKNFFEIDPEMIKVPYTQEAHDLREKYNDYFDEEYNKCAEYGSEIGKTTWGRACEIMNRLALDYTCSVDHTNLIVTIEGVEWAYRVMKHQIDSSLFMASKFVHINKTDEDMNKVITLLKENDGYISKSRIMQRYRFSAKDMADILRTMEDMKIIEIEYSKGKGRPATYIKYIGE